jgi:adenosylcobinamide-GDP ribazoletransferase
MDFFRALSFLTVLRVGRPKVYDEKELAGWGRYFFLIGLVIGAMIAGLDYLIYPVMSPLMTGAVITLFVVLITGGLHLDGLVDTFDAAFSMKSAEEKLAIMRDSQVGAFGVIAIVFVILFKVVLISEVQAVERLKVLAAFPAVSRGSLLLPAYLFKYPREAGKGKGFVKYMTLKIVLTGLLVSAVAMYLLMQVNGLMILGASMIFSMLIAFIFNRKLNGITGDVLGAVNELTEIFVLFFAVLT